jgi:hypothetical protein
MGKASLLGTWIVLGPTLSIILLINLTLANVPLAITSSFPLLDPYELKSTLSTPLDYKYLAAGEFTAIAPAGEI